jgi:hypothetical protein
MRKPVLALACILPLAALGACNKADPAATAAALQATLGAASATSPKLAAAALTVNAKIASASAKLSAYCTLAEVSLAGASLFGSAGGAISAARTVVSDFCSSPPSDPVSAYVLVQGAMADLQAHGITVKSVQKLSLQQDRYAARRLMQLHLAAKKL